MRLSIIGLLTLVTMMFITSCGVNPVERNNAGNTFTRRGDYEQALRAYEVALVNAPNNALYYFNSAQAFEANGDVQRAIEALEQAVERGNVSLQVAAYHNLGNIYFRQENYEDAISAYQEALRLDDNSENTRYNLELALATRLQPTPTAREMQTNPEEQQADNQVTPTPNPLGMTMPTPTPSPLPPPPDFATPEDLGEGGEPVDENRMTPLPQEGDYTVEDAERVLEPLEEQQQTMGGLPDMPSMGTTPGAKDW
jgi:tetratricopeptide (TPR) repeat protein